MKRTPGRTVPEVTLIPWVHDVNWQKHGEVIAYLEKLPKNSVLAMETTPREYELIQSLQGMVANTDRKIERLLGWNGLASLEVIHTCEKRNIQIVPLETTATELRGTKRQSPAKRMDFREQTMVEQIRAARVRLRRPKLIVLAGTWHTLELQKRLQEMRIPVRVNLEVFSQPEKVQRDLRTGQKYSEAIREGRMAEAEWINLLAKTKREPRRGSSSRVRTQLREKLKKRESAQWARWSRKSELHRRKQLQRPR